MFSYSFMIIQSSCFSTLPFSFFSPVCRASSTCLSCSSVCQHRAQEIMLIATGQIYSNMTGRVHGQKDPQYLPEHRCPLERRGQRGEGLGVEGRAIRAQAPPKCALSGTVREIRPFPPAPSFSLYTSLTLSEDSLSLYRCLCLSHTHIEVSHPYRLQHPLRGLRNRFLPDTEKSSHYHTVIFGAPLSDHHRNIYACMTPHCSLQTN